MREFYIPEAEMEARMPDEVYPYLAERRSEGYFAGCDGEELHYVTYTQTPSRATVIVSHGFTENAEKFHELSYYLLKEGYSVCLPEHRGHGLSHRKLSDTTLTHIDSFSEYVADFSLFVEKVRAETVGPLYLFAHSMGGAIGILYMEEHPAVFLKAFLSAPMIEPNGHGFPWFLSRMVAGTACLIRQGERRAFVSGAYPGEEQFEDACKTSEARFMEYENLKRKNPELQNYAPTYSWVYQSLGVKKQILRKGAPEGIQTRVFLAMAGQDDLVLRAPQEAFLGRLRFASSRVFEDAKHEIYGSADRTAFEFFDTLLDFYNA